MKKMKLHYRILYGFFLLLFPVIFAPLQSAKAADHANLEEGLPTAIEDANTIGYLGREIQSYFRWERTKEEEDRFEAVPRFEYGPLRNLQISLSYPFFAGDADRTGSGETEIEALYNFNTESVILPAFSIAGGITLPTGKGSEGFDTTLKLIASKMPFPKSFLLHRLHLNLVWNHNAAARSEERDDHFKAALGFSVRAGKDTVVVTDVVRETDKEKDRESNMVELGFRRQITPLTVLVAGISGGFGDESPEFRMTTGFQHSF